MPTDEEMLSGHFRIMLSYAIQDKLEKYAGGIEELGPAKYEEMLTLALQVTGHVVVETAERWPNDADLVRISEIAANARTNLPIDQDEIYAYLSGVVFGNKKFDTVSEDRQKAAVIPMMALANIMISFLPKGLDQWGWLDAIEASIELVNKTSEATYPSFVYAFGKTSRA